ncbi:hypothetical protein [Methylopila sp. M107]|uniref:hypothetical protein n=1 Tax=Methylopila sp. M107 TaxID=1101190 RepID=UPI00037BB143|nr:hypothetical protein [Methylopila sp. M107]
MPFVTAATDGLLDAQSFPFESRDEAIVKAIALVEAGKESVSVTDVDSGEVLTGEELLAAIEALAARGEEA